MRFLSIVRQHFSQAASHSSSFKASLHDSAIRQNKISKQNLQKLDVLAEIILTMKNAELDYLKSYLISNSKNAEKTQISAKVYSALSSQTENQLDHKIRMHFYQQEWIQQVWKDKHILTTLISTEPDAEIDQQQAEVIKQIYDFELTSVDPAQKIKVIKVLRELLGLGLKEAKDVVDKAPIVFKKGKKQEGQGIQKQLAAAGCVVTLK